MTKNNITALDAEPVAPSPKLLFSSQIADQCAASTNKNNSYASPQKATGRPAGYYSWTGMRQRCDNANHISYADYGGRGISYDPAWKSFDGFIDDLGKPPTRGHSLDRIDPDGDYHPANCRWATKAEQAQNRRNTVWVEIDGTRHSLAELARKLGISRATLMARLKAGRPVKEAISSPVVRGGDRRSQRQGLRNRWPHELPLETREYLERDYRAAKSSGTRSSRPDFFLARAVPSLQAWLDDLFATDEDSDEYPALSDKFLRIARCIEEAKSLVLALRWAQ